MLCQISLSPSSAVVFSEALGLGLCVIRSSAAASELLLSGASSAVLQSGASATRRIHES